MTIVSQKTAKRLLYTTASPLVFICAQQNAFAKQEMQFGLGVGTSFLTVKDPAGKTEKATSLEYINPIVTIPIVSRNWRLNFNILYAEYKFNGTNNLINQDAEHLSIQSQVQYNLRLSKELKPWLGLGIGLNKDEFTNRYTVDNDGYLIESYDSRTENSSSFIGSITNEWELNDSFNFGLTLQYEQTLGNALEGFRVTGSLLY